MVRWRDLLSGCYSLYNWSLKNSKFKCLFNLYKKQLSYSSDYILFCSYINYTVNGHELAPDLTNVATMPSNVHTVALTFTPWRRSWPVTICSAGARWLSHHHCAIVTGVSGLGAKCSGVECDITISWLEWLATVNNWINRVVCSMTDANLYP